MIQVKNKTGQPDCDHVCSGNCRRNGCNCECGEFHGKFEEEKESGITLKKGTDRATGLYNTRKIFG